MKTRCLLLFTMLLTCPTVLQAAAIPLFTVSVKNHATMIESAATVANALRPGSGDHLDRKLRGELGIAELAGIDTTRPWQMAVWFQGIGTRPNTALFIPISDFRKFLDGLEPGRDLKGRNNSNLISETDGYAVIIERQNADVLIPDETRDRIRAWRTKLPKSLPSDFEMRIALDDQARMQLQQGLAMGRTILSQTFNNPNVPKTPGLDPPAMLEVMALYFNVLDIFAKGIETVTLRADVSAAGLSLSEKVLPKAGTELATWLKQDGKGVADLARHIDYSAPMSMAVRAGAGPKAKKLIGQAALAGYRMQKMDLTEEARKQTVAFIDALLPLRMVFTLDFSNGYSFGGFSQYPESSAEEVYATTRRFFESTMPLQVGEDKFYKDWNFKAGAREVAGMKVDRLVTTINPDAPMLQMPGQKELIESMWPGGRLVMEYAVEGDRLYSGMGDGLAVFLKGAKSSPPKHAFKADPTTSVIGQMNLLQFVIGAMTANPMIPPNAKARFKTLDPADTAMHLKINLDGNLQSEAFIPLKFISEIGKLGKQAAE